MLYFDKGERKRKWVQALNILSSYERPNCTPMELIVTIILFLFADHIRLLSCRYGLLAPLMLIDFFVLHIHSIGSPHIFVKDPGVELSVEVGH